MLRRASFLLRDDPALFAKKLYQRLKRNLARRREIRAELGELRNAPAAVSFGSGKNDLLTALAAKTPTVVLERRTDYVHCAVNAPDVAKAVAAACQSLPNIGLIVGSEPIRLKPAELMRQCCNSAAFTLGAMDAANRCRWRFEIYDRTESGSFSSRAGESKIAGILYGDVFEKPGIIDLTITMPELNQRLNSKAIDIVYTWVNYADPDWRKAFLTATDRGASKDACSESRFFCNDELRYSLRSVHANLPWAGTIHIVSNCSPPPWLNTAHPKIHWVAHEAILPAECLPTFNSHAIETSLHRIPGVSDNFLYFNDDFFAFDALSPSTFINENGTLIANLERQGVVNSAVDPASPDYLNAARNSARLLYERFGYYPTRLHRHTPYSLSRILLKEIETEFGDALERTQKARFRSASDINVPSFLAHHFGFIKRAVVYGDYPSALVKSNDPFSRLAMRYLTRSAIKPKVVCLNEGGVPAPKPAWRREAEAFMSRAFPKAAPWEHS